MKQKRVHFLFFISAVLLYSCTPEPEASFDIMVNGEKSNEVFINEEVSFVNNSVDSDEYEWYFGDSFDASTEVNPTHAYTTDGIYDVTLIAFSGTKKDKRIKEVIVHNPAITKLIFHVDFEDDGPNWEAGHPVVNADVSLYRTFKDYVERQNAVETGGDRIKKTNEFGWVFFEVRSKGDYFVHARIEIDGQIYNNDWECGNDWNCFSPKEPLNVDQLGVNFEFSIHLKKIQPRPHN
jgi:hypothetical protein